MKIRLKDRVANLYHKQQGIPRAGHVLSQPVSIAEAMQDSIHSGWLFKVGFSVRTWKKRFFVLTNTALFYYKSDKSARQRGEIILSHITEVAEATGSLQKPNSISIATSDRVFYVVGNDEEDASKWMSSLTSKIALKLGQTQTALEIAIDPESFPPMCQEAQMIANDLTQMKNTILESFNEGSAVIQKQMGAIQEKFESFEREYGYIAQAQQLGKEIRECLNTCAANLVTLQAEEEALFQASKIRSKANWLRDAIDVGDPEQLARHIHEMRSAFIPFKEKYASQTSVKAVMPIISEFEGLLTRADSALSLIDDNLDKLDGIDIIIGKITWLSDAIERGNIQDLQKHIQEMKEILSAFTEKHGDDQNALPITTQGQDLLITAERRLNKLQRHLPDSPMAFASPGIPTLNLASSPIRSAPAKEVIVPADTGPPIVLQEVLVSSGGTNGAATGVEVEKALDASGGLLGAQVYCSLKHTGKVGRLQKYVVCITCENYDATICLNCRDVCHAGHDVTYEREAEGACDCGIGVFANPCACLVTQVTRKNAAEIEDIHKQVTAIRKARTFTDIINEISIFQNQNPPAGWSDATRDPCGLIFANPSKKDQGFTSELHKQKNMRVVFSKQAILKGMGQEVLLDSFTDDDPIYGRVFLPAAPARIPVSEYPGEDVTYSKVSCFTGIVLYVDGQLWLPPSATPSPNLAHSSSFSSPSTFSPHPTSPRRKYTTLAPTASPALSITRRTHQAGHVRSQSNVGVPQQTLSPIIPTPSSTYHPTPSAAVAAAVTSAVVAVVPGVASVVARKSTSRRDSINRISRRFSFNNLNINLSPPVNSSATCTCNNSTCTCNINIHASTSIPNSTTINTNNTTTTTTTTSSTVAASHTNGHTISTHVPNPLLSSAQNINPTRASPHTHTRTHSRNNSTPYSPPVGPTVGGSAGFSPEQGFAVPITGSTNLSFYGEVGGTMVSPTISLNGMVGDSASSVGSPVTPPNHFFELSMVSGEPQWEWTTYRLMLSPTPNDPDAKIYQTQISNWQKVVMDLTPGTHRIRLEIALGPNPPIRYCVAYGEFEYTVTEAHTSKVKKAEQDAMKAVIVKEWKDKYTYGTVESDIAGKWIYQMDGSLKCCDGPYTGAEYTWTGNKLEKKSEGLDSVFECVWHPNRHPPELDVHFLPELATCGFTISHPHVSLILTNSGVTVSGSVPPPLVTLLAELRFIDREYRQSRTEYEFKLAQKKKYEEIKGHLTGRVCPSCNSGQNWLICTKCFVDFCGCYTSIDPHCPVCNCIDNLTNFDDSFPT